MARTSSRILLEDGDHVWIKVHPHTAIVEMLFGDDEFRILLNDANDAKSLQREFRKATDGLVGLVDEWEAQYE